MGDHDKIGVRAKAVGEESEACAAWAMLLPDAAEGLLSEAEQKAVDLHVAGCAACAHQLADAQCGAAWLGLLKGHTPEPPANLLQSILARTSGPSEMALPVVSEPGSYALDDQPLWSGAMGLGAKAPPASLPGFAGLFADLQHGIQRWFGVGDRSFPALQPRFAMTAAMAFFSVCLTLNLLGVSVRSLHAESLRPAGLQRTVADTGASLVRSFEGIRAVYRVEARVNDWRTASGGQSEPALDTSR